MTVTEAEDHIGPWSAVDQLVHLFRTRSSDEAALVAAVCDQAVALVENVTDAGVILAGGRRHLDIVAASGPVPRVLDEYQQQSGTGPCLDAARDRTLVRLDDTATDERWDRFPAAAMAAGVGSMLCLPLRVDETAYGTLSLYSAKPHGIAATGEPVATVLATLAAITLSEFRGRANLQTALASRDLIGQAKGILMSSRRITADAAFALLRERSQVTNTKLVDVAEAVVRTGTL